MEQEQNRSEAPTAYKLMRARRKGQIARGLDLGFFATTAALLAYAWIGGTALLGGLSAAMRDALVSSTLLVDDHNAVLMVVVDLFGRIERPLALLLLSLFVLVLLLELLQTGFIFSSEPLRPDFSRLNPAEGLKRLFNMRMLLETAKNLVKLALYSVASWLLIRSSLRNDIADVHDAAGLVRASAHAAPRLLALFVGIALVVAIADQMIARGGFLKRMRMSRRELKQEVRDREGEPRLKQKRKQMHGEFVRNSRSLKGVRGADMLLVNPIHVAVALRYDPATMAAPVVAAAGSDRLAMRLKRLALLYGVPVVEDAPLARALLSATPIDRTIPSGTFQQVASHYNRLRRPRASQGASR